MDSHIALLEEIFTQMDKYDDYILIRADFIYALRNNEEIKMFLNKPAVQLAKSRKTLTFDEVLCEIEHEKRLTEADKIATFESHLYDKKYITFREFLNYYQEFKPAEERYQQEKYGNNKEEPMSGPIPRIEESENEEILDKVPRLREEDKIDANDEHINLIHDIFDSIPRLEGTNSVIKLEFFLTIYKDPQIKRILTAIAREPDGKSRIQRETFQEVFNRMEKYELGDRINWSSIIEYFTKRGRPLTKAEKDELLRQDKVQDENIKKEEEDKKEEEKEFYDNLRKTGENNSFIEDDPLAGDVFNPFPIEPKEENKNFEIGEKNDKEKSR